jgi:hypothetical protein
MKWLNGKDAEKLGIVAEVFNPNAPKLANSTKQYPYLDTATNQVLFGPGREKKLGIR